MNRVPYELIVSLADEFQAVECFWRESDRSFTGFVAEIWFNEQPKNFAIKWASVVGYFIKVRLTNDGSGRFVVSVPCEVPQGQVNLSYISRGSRVKLIP